MEVITWIRFPIARTDSGPVKDNDLLIGTDPDNSMRLVRNREQGRKWPCPIPALIDVLVNAPATLGG